jgi:hypothetical protein
MAAAAAVDERGDDVEPGHRRRPDQRQPDLLDERTELPGAEPEEAQGRVDAGVVVDHLEAVELGELRGDGELARRGRAVDQDVPRPSRPPRFRGPLWSLDRVW